MSRIKKIKAFAKIELGINSDEFYELTPFDLSFYVGAWETRERRADAYSALVASLLTNINRDVKKNKKPFEVEDFLMFFKSPKKIGAETEAADLETYIINTGIPVNNKSNG